MGSNAMSETDCILCRIVRGEIQPRKIFESERILGIVNDLEPFSRGHVVFFPKRHAAQLTAASDEDLAEILVAVKRAAVVLAAPAYNVLQNNGELAGQTVFHLHVHLIPKWSENEGLVYQREHHPKVDHGDLHRRLKDALAGSQS